MTFGLYQGETIYKKWRMTVISNYCQKQFLPMITASLEQRLSGNEASNPEIHYQLLKVYLMLGDS